MIKSIIAIMVSVLISSCVTTINGSTKTLKFEKADKISYTLGKEMKNGKSSGTSYTAYFDTKGDVKITKVWINGINMDFEQVKTSENSFRVRSTFYRGTKSNQHPKIKAPIEYEGTALYEYTDNGETKYFVLKIFKELKKYEGAR